MIGRGFLTSVIYEDPPPILLTPTPFSNIVRPSTIPHWSSCCLVSLKKWMIAPNLMCYLLLNEMGLHIWILGNLVVPQGLCSVSYATRHQFTEI